MIEEDHVKLRGDLQAGCDAALVHRPGPPMVGTEWHQRTHEKSVQTRDESLNIDVIRTLASTIFLPCLHAKAVVTTFPDTFTVSY